MRIALVSGAALAVFAASPAFAALVVSDGATSDVTCINGTCTATAADAVLNAKDFRHLIGAGDLTLVSGSAAQDIVIAAKVQYTKTHHLTLDSFRGIAFQLELASEGGGGVTIKTNDGGSGGAITYSGKGKLTFWDTASSLVIDGTSYTLANDIATLAADIAANPSGAFALGRGYDASADGTYAAPPIPTTFTGTFTGLGHIITNLTIDYHKHTGTVGLFAAIGTGGQASDVSLDTESVTSSSVSYVAMFAGTNAGSIRNVSVSGGVHESSLRGKSAGFVGWNTGTISAARSAGQIGGGARYSVTAGLVAVNQGPISHSASSMIVTAGAEACGLVALNYATVTLSSATGPAGIVDQHNENSYAAGLVCENAGTVSQSFSTGSVYAGFGKEGENFWVAYGGGLVGANDPGSTIRDCYSLGAVSADPELSLGGLVSISGGTIATSYSAGTVPATPVQYTGGLIGQFFTEGGNTNDYWDLTASGISDPTRGAGNAASTPGITGLTTAQFQSGLPAGFDPAVWAESPSINNGYPYLIANPPM